VLGGLVLGRGIEERGWIHIHGARLVSSALLSFVPRALQVLRVMATPEHVTIEAGPRGSSAECPVCGFSSRRVHSGYHRELRDLPWQGRPVTIRVSARRFRCVNVACARKTFAERLDNVAMVSARRTERLGNLQHHLALALGGEAGARLAARIAVPTSADTLLRMAAATTSCEIPSLTPRVLAVDDWAWRRGHRYGTILVDLERNQVVDLLPDRQAETLAAWLRQHPGIEVVARDRAGAYADGVRQGLPEAVQVADRWHLLRNLGDAVRAVVDRHHGAIRRITKQISEETTASAIAAIATPVAATLTAATKRSQAAYARRQARYEEAARLRSAGASIKRIATLLGSERKTIRGWLRAGSAPLWRKPPRSGVLAPFLDFLDRRWIEGCRNAALLWRELVSRGFSGRPGTVRQWAGQRRKAEPNAARNAHDEQAVTSSAFSGRQLARLLMVHPEALAETEQKLVSRVLTQMPSLADSIAVAKRLNTLLRRKSDESLDDVLEAAAGTALTGFAAGLRRDLGAVRAALELPWTTSPAESQINRLKMLKRTMYGRADFGLLRARVLHAA
jgi:transposase